MLFLFQDKHLCAVRGHRLRKRRSGKAATDRDDVERRSAHARTSS
jgi:hypothetical protein